MYRGQNIRSSRVTQEGHVWHVWHFFFFFFCIMLYRIGIRPTQRAVQPTSLRDGELDKGGIAITKVVAETVLPGRGLDCKHV